MSIARPTLMQQQKSLFKCGRHRRSPPPFWSPMKRLVLRTYSVVEKYKIPLFLNDYLLLVPWIFLDGLDYPTTVYFCACIAVQKIRISLTIFRGPGMP